KKVEIGALRAAIAQKLKDGQVLVIDALTVTEVKTRAAAETLKRLGVERKALLIDVMPDEKFERSVRNLRGISFVASSRLTARDVMNADRIVATRTALEKLQEALAS